MIFLLLVAVAALKPRVTPSFVIDLDVDASQRYLEVYRHFAPIILQMEDYFYNSIPETTRNFYATDNNLELFSQANPDVFAAMQSLATVLDVDVL
jgi:hypothetical protein